jgi:hypothetical protein
MKKIFSISVFCITFCINAQIASRSVDANDFQYLTNEIANQKYHKDLDIKEDYLNKNFVNAKITNVNSKVKLRYNIYYDSFEFIKDDKLYRMNKYDNQIIDLENKKTFIYKTYTLKGNSESSYLQVLSNLEKPIVLLKRYIISKSENSGKNGVNQTFSSNELYNKDELYILSFNNKYEVVSNSSNKTGEFLKKDIATLVKSNKLNLKKEEDLKKLVDLLNK